VVTSLTGKRLPAEPTPPPGWGLRSAGGAGGTGARRV